MSVIPFIEGNRILEIGHGPGHLQRFLLSRDLVAVGIDESAPMGRLARRNLARDLVSRTLTSPGNTRIPSQKPQQIGYTKINLTRGLAQSLPFRDGSFDTVVATFPSDYIFDPITLAEAQRVLTKNGRFVILPGTAILGRGLMDRIMALLFRITGETPPNLLEVLRERTSKSFADTSFHVQVHELDVRSSRVFILVATNSSR